MTRKVFINDCILNFSEINVYNFIYIYPGKNGHYLRQCSNDTLLLLYNANYYYTVLHYSVNVSNKMNNCLV